MVLGYRGAQIQSHKYRLSILSRPIGPNTAILATNRTHCSLSLYTIGDFASVLVLILVGLPNIRRPNISHGRLQH